MKTFLKYIFTIILLVGIVSASFFNIVNRGLRKQKVDIYGKMNEIVLGKENFDIVFIGSSRINLTVNPAIIDSLTGLNSFNFGFDGANIIDFNMHLQSYLKTHVKPKLLVLNIDPKMFNVTDEIKVPPSKYLPYLDYPEIYDTLSLYSKWPFVAKYFPFVGVSFYTDGIVNQSVQAYVSPDRKMENYYKGFSPLTKVWANADKSAANLLPVECTLKGLALFHHFLERVKLSGIKFQLIYCPQYDFKGYELGHKQYISKLRSIADEFQYEINDYSTLDICNEKYFFDATHLNLVGANIFSRKLGEDLSNKIKKQ